MTLPRRSLLICCLQRSGSWLLADGLKMTGVAGIPEEYFWHEFREDYLGHWGHPTMNSFADFLKRSFEAGTTANGVFSVKLHWDELDELCSSLRTLPGSEDLDAPALLQRHFPDPRIVHLRREDVVRQAVSWYRAASSIAWYDVVGEERPREDPEPDWTRIGLMEDLLRSHELQWAQLFDDLGRDVLHLVYEDVTENYERAVEDVLRHTGVAWPDGLVLPPPRLRRQRDGLTEEWVQQYLVERRGWRLLEVATR